MGSDQPRVIRFDRTDLVAGGKNLQLHKRLTRPLVLRVLAYQHLSGTNGRLLV